MALMPDPSFITAIIDCTGLTEADIKKVEPAYTRDAFTITAWNWRKYVVSGYDLARKGRR